MSDNKNKELHMNRLSGSNKLMKSPWGNNKNKFRDKENNNKFREKNNNNNFRDRDSKNKPNNSKREQFSKKNNA